MVDTSTKHLFSARATLSQSPEQDEHVENPVEGNIPLAEEREKKVRTLFIVSGFESVASCSNPVSPWGSLWSRRLIYN